MNPHAPDYPGEFVFLRKTGTCALSSLRMAVPADARLDELLEEFAGFLRAAGYSVPEDHALDFVPHGGAFVSCDPQLRDTIETDGTSAEEFG